MSELLVETRGQSGWLILNRPKAFNSLTRTILDDLAIALTDFETRNSRNKRHDHGWRFRTYYVL